MVLDASTVLEVLLDTALGRAAAQYVADPAEALHVPHLLDVEVAQALRRQVRDEGIAASTAAEVLRDLQELDLVRHPHEPLLDRVWALRHNLSAYDAVYVALAEALETPLVTCDRRLARAAGLRCEVLLVD